MWQYNHTQRPDELYHWKYIKKTKTPSGRTQYFYNQAELNAYEKGLKYARPTTEEDKKEVNKNRKNKLDTTPHINERTVVEYKQSDKLLSDQNVKWDKTVNLNKYDKDQKDTTTYKATYTQGKLDRKIAKVEKKIYDKVLKDDSPYRTWKKSKIDEGKATIERLFSRHKKK